MLLTFSKLPFNARYFKPVCNAIFDTYFTLVKNIYGEHVNGSKNIVARLVAELYPDRAMEKSKYKTICSQSHVHMLFWITNGKNFPKVGFKKKVFYNRFHQNIKYTAFDLDIYPLQSSRNYEQEFVFKPHVSFYDVYNQDSPLIDHDLDTHYPPNDENDPKVVELMQKCVKEYEELQYNSMHLAKNLEQLNIANNARKWRFYLHEIKSSNYDLFYDAKSKNLKIGNEIWLQNDFRIWKEKNLAINKNGQIYNLKTKRLLKGFPQNQGYIQIRLPGGGTKVLHKIIAEAFLGIPPPDYKYVRHKNGNLSDNRLENLEWSKAKRKNKQTSQQKAQQVLTSKPMSTIFSKQTNAEKQKLKRIRQKMRLETFSNLEGLKGTQREEAIDKLEFEMQHKPYEVSGWLRIAENYGKQESWGDIKVQKQISKEIKHHSPYIIQQPKKLDNFLQNLRQKAAAAKDKNRRRHDEILQSDAVVKIFKLKTLVRKNEVKWIQKVAAWIDTVLRYRYESSNRQFPTKRKNLWIYGPSNMGKTEHVITRLQKEFSVWNMEKSTAITNAPGDFDYFTIVDEAQNINKKDIQKFKCLTDQSSRYKVIRTFRKLCIHFFSL